MCRLFGFRSVVPGRAHRSLIDAENALSLQSKGHPDGWGIGWFADDEAYVLKSANAAHASDRFKRASRILSSQTMLVHVRRATIGLVDHLNAHPFRYGRWLMAHNGTLFDFEALSPWLTTHTEEIFFPHILGDTDSEQIFFYLLSSLHRAGVDRTGRRPSNAQTILRTLRAALFSLNNEAARLGVALPILNVLLSDGRVFFAHRAGMPLFLSTQKRRCADFDRCPEPSKVCMLAVRPSNQPINHLLVASEPIGDENRWEAIADGTSLILDEVFMLTQVAPPDDWVKPFLPEHLKLRATL